ncbi:MAG: GNAT family N-acetyltransferase [Pseudomonadota bacterium]
MKAQAPETWTTEAGLTGRKIAASDLDFVNTLFADPRMLAHHPNPSPTPPRTSLEGDLDHWSRHGIGRWSVWRGDARVGLCGLTLRDGYSGLNLSYHVVPAEWGQGWATHIVRQLITIAAGLSPAPPQVFGLVRPSNRASARVLEKTEFEKTDVRHLGGAPTDLWVKPL